MTHVHNLVTGYRTKELTWCTDKDCSYCVDTSTIPQTEDTSKRPRSEEMIK